MDNRSARQVRYDYDFNYQVRKINLDIVNDDLRNSSVQPKKHPIKELGVELFFAHTQELRNQYYELRQQSFQEVDEEYRSRNPQDCLDWEDYDGSETEDDRRGSILIATDVDGKVVAGARFLLSTSKLFTNNEEPWNGFSIRKFLQDKGYNPEAKYCEIDDIVIAKQFRTRLLLKKMFRIMIERAEDEYCDYMFGLAIASACRNDRLMFHSLGYKGEIHMDYPWIKQKNHGYETRYPFITELA